MGRTGLGGIRLYRALPMNETFRDQPQYKTIGSHLGTRGAGRAPKGASKNARSGKVRVLRDQGFNPLPPSKRGETCSLFALSDGDRSFNPLPPSKRGETRLAGTSRVMASMFQSAPPVETRGDPAHLPVRARVRSFNPLPPSKRGETSASRPTAPLCSSFNPLPPSKRGETRHKSPRSHARPSFNPLPPSKRGETTRKEMPKIMDWNVSIRSPRRNEGRLIFFAIYQKNLLFQSAPPVETRGDWTTYSAPASRLRFQSAPPVETRGDSRSAAN